MHVRTIIVEDEEHSADSLMRLLEPYMNRLHLIGIYKDDRDAIEAINSARPDLVFMDVQLQNHSTAFDVLKALDNLDFQIVFTTAYDQYAVQAFRFSALDYLLKPIDENDLSVTMERFFKSYRLTQDTRRIDQLLHHIVSDKPLKISIPTMEGYVFLDIDQIVRCQSDINYTILFTQDKKQYLASKTLKHFESLLSARGFLRVHNSHLVNLKYITKYTKGSGGYITLSDQTTVEVSVRKKDQLLRYFSLNSPH